jgi:hypothetical protein
MLLWSGSCAAEPADDMLLRAAYCVGVLGETLFFTQTGTPTIVPPQWAAGCRQADPQVWSINECVAAMSKFADKMHQTLKERRGRYDRYLSSAFQFLDGVPAVQARSLYAVIAKGRSDVVDKMAATSATTKCFENCLLASAQRAGCIVECVAQEDQVHANVLRCQLMPDPF